MHSYRHHRGLVLVPTLIAAVAALLLGAPPASASTWRTCDGTPHYVTVKVKGAACSTAQQVYEDAMSKTPPGLPVDWSGSVGRWKCTYINNQGPGRMDCSKGAQKFRVDHGA